MEESVRAEQFLYVKHALQYLNGHAARWAYNISSKVFDENLFWRSGHSTKSLFDEMAR